jgi:hypothetical protein
LSALDGVAAPDAELDADARIDGLIGAGAARTERDGELTERSGLHGSDVSRALCQQRDAMARRRQPCGIVDDTGVPPVRGDHSGETLGTRAARDRLIEEQPRAFGVCLTSCREQHLNPERQRELARIVRALAGQDIDGFADLEGVADGEADRRGHVGQERTHGQSEPCADRSQRLTEGAGLARFAHERAAAHFYVHDQGVEPGCQLLREDAGDDEGNARHGSRHVAQRVHAPIGGGKVVGLPDDRDADATHDGPEPGRREARVVPGDRLELVERAARVPEPPPRDHRHGDATRGYERCQAQADFVAHSARRVLVDFCDVTALVLELTARMQHGMRQGDRLFQ